MSTQPSSSKSPDVLPEDTESQHPTSPSPQSSNWVGSAAFYESLPRAIVQRFAALVEQLRSQLAQATKAKDEECTRSEQLESQIETMIQGLGTMVEGLGNHRANMIRTGAGTQHDMTYLNEHFDDGPLCHLWRAITQTLALYESDIEQYNGDLNIVRAIASGLSDERAKLRSDVAAQDTEIAAQDTEIENQRGIIERLLSRHQRELAMSKDKLSKQELDIIKSRDMNAEIDRQHKLALDKKDAKILDLEIRLKEATKQISLYETSIDAKVHHAVTKYNEKLAELRAKKEELAFAEQDVEAFRLQLEERQSEVLRLENHAREDSEELVALRRELDETKQLLRKQ